MFTPLIILSLSNALSILKDQYTILLLALKNKIEPYLLDTTFIFTLIGAAAQIIFPILCILFADKIGIRRFSFIMAYFYVLYEQIFFWLDTWYSNY